MLTMLEEDYGIIYNKKLREGRGYKGDDIMILRPLKIAAKTSVPQR